MERMNIIHLNIEQKLCLIIIHKFVNVHV